VAARAEAGTNRAMESSCHSMSVMAGSECVSEFVLSYDRATPAG
jgi:hypothetical protein